LNRGEVGGPKRREKGKSNGKVVGLAKTRRGGRVGMNKK